MASGKEGLSLRAQTKEPHAAFLMDYGGEALDKMYRPLDNPTGIVNFGIAESVLCEDILTEKFREPKMNVYEPYMQYYFGYNGFPNFRQTIAEFLMERLHTKETVNSDDILVTSGVGAALDYLAYCLGNPGDYFMVFTPVYPGFYMDLGFRAQLGLVEIPVPTKDREDTLAYEHNVRDLAAAYARAQKEGKTVRGVIVVNPGNPTGNVTRIEKVVEILEFCNEHNLHVIMNEIYALSVFDETAKFNSVLTVNHPDPEKMHFVWGFSKDFGCSGVRCGVLYSRNKAIVADCGHLLTNFYLGSVTPIMQEKLRVLLADKEWLDNVYFPTNMKRIKAAYKLTCDHLEELGVEFVKPQGGIFLLVNFKKYMTENTKEGEIALFRKLFDAGVYLMPGFIMETSEPGWFRITFTNSDAILEEGFRRLKSVLGKATT